MQNEATAQATLENAQKKYDTVKQQTDQDIEQAKTKVGEAQAALDNANANRSLDTSASRMWSRPVRR